MDTSRDAARYSGEASVSTEGAGRVARSAGVVAGSTLASRVFGLGRDVVVANLFAAGATDAFFLAFMIPNLFRRLVAEGSLTLSFVPVFTASLARSRDEARRVLDTTWTLATLVGLAVTVAGMVFAGPLVDLFAPGFALDPPKRELCVRLLRLCFPYVGLMMLVAVAMGALNALGHFFTPAIAPVLLNLALIAGAFVGASWMATPIEALGWAVIVAGLLQALLQLPPLARRGMRPSPGLDLGQPAVRRLAALMGPAALGASVFQINVLVSRFLASFLGDGAVSYLYYADRLLELPLGVFIFALGMASLPSFARLATRGAHDALRTVFADTLGLALVLAAGSSVGLVLLREPIFAVLFAWDPSVFGEQAVSGCARALLYYALGLVPIAIARVCVMLSVAHEDTRVPARGAVVSVVAHAVAALALVGPLPAGALPGPLLAGQHALAVVDMGYAGLALAATLGSLVNALYLWLALRRRHGPLVRVRDVARFARIALAVAALAAVVQLSTWLLPVPPAASLAALLLLALHIALGVLAYGAALAALGTPEFRALARLIRRQAG
jgi:putative peptidoglycan lipid II flippase